MKILHVDINGWVYGVQRYVITFCKYLNMKEGFRCIVVGPSGTYLSTLREENIETIPLREEWAKIDLDLKGWIRLYEVIKRIRPDVIHSHGTKEHIISKIIAGMLGIPSIPIYHCRYKLSETDDAGISLKRRLYEMVYLEILERYTSRLALKNIAVSHSVKDNIKRFGIPEEKIEVIYSGIELNEPAPQMEKDEAVNGSMKILFLGRIDENKGVLDVVRAAKIVKQKGYTFEMKFVGDGPLRRECEHLVEEYGLRREITFLGYLKNVRELFLTSDIFVSASYSEGLPLNIIEAMGCGLPVIATGVGGTTEIINHGEDGIVIPMRDVRELANALISLMEDARLREKYGTNGRRRIEQEFRAEVMVASFVNFYNHNGIDGEH
jgi:glycosyltransferase involved in cell wall biosynthesis